MTKPQEFAIKQVTELCLKETSPQSGGVFFMGGVMSQIVIAWKDIEGLKGFSSAIRSIQSQNEFGHAARRAINKTGDMARTQVRRALIKQTGLKRKVIVKAIRIRRANYKYYQYEMFSRGGDISLKYFSPRETRKGISVKLPDGRKIIAGSFMKGGQFPNRVDVDRFEGHVFERDGGARFPINKVKSGVFIPTEMVNGETAMAFQISIKKNLPRLFAHEIKRISNNIFS